jgi:hypothetical protein
MYPGSSRPQKKPPRGIRRMWVHRTRLLGEVFWRFLGPEMPQHLPHCARLRRWRGAVWDSVGRGMQQQLGDRSALARNWTTEVSVNVVKHESAWFNACVWQMAQKTGVAILEGAT